MGESTSDTVFVRGLSFQVTDDDLFEAFSNIGPVKSAFIIAEKDGPNKGKSKGFGFVQFALAEDAAEAVEKMQGTKIRDHAILLDLAEKKGHKHGKSSGAKRPAPVAKPRPQQPLKTTSSSSSKPTPKPSGEDFRHDNLFKKLADDIVSSKKDIKDETELYKEKIKTTEFLRDCSVIIFNVPPTMNAAQLKKKASKFGRVNIAEVPLKSIDLPDYGMVNALVIYTKKTSAAKACEKINNKMWEKSFNVHCRRVKHVGMTEKQLHKSRLVVRNLSFKATADNIRDAFSQFGPVLDVKLPTKAIDDDSKEESALQTLNGTKIASRIIAVDWALPKTEYERLQREQDQAQNNKEEEEEEEGDKESEPDHEESDVDEADDNGSDSGDSNEDEDDDDEEEEGEEEEEEKAQEELKSTLFLRNVLFESTQDSVYQVFKKYGPVRYVKLAKFPDGRNKGTGFVNYYKPESLERALRAAAEIPNNPSKKGGSDQTANDEEGGLGIECDGRPLLVTRALEREDAKDLEKSREKKVVDKRNLYLSREGVIYDNQEVDVPKSDLNKRKTAEMEKKAKLKSPLFFVSPTRLSVRNLFRGDDENPEVDEKMLMKVFKEAAQKGIDENVVGSNEGNLTLFPRGWPSKKHLGAPYVEKAVVLREEALVAEDGEGPAKKNPRKRKGRSKGFGFLEFKEHAHALAALRMLNNNPEYGYLASGGPKAMSVPVPKRSRLIVAFAVENAKKLHIQKERKQKQQQSQKLDQNAKLALAYANKKRKESAVNKSDEEKMNSNNNKKRKQMDARTKSKKNSDNHDDAQNLKKKMMKKKEPKRSPKRKADDENDSKEDVKQPKKKKQQKEKSTAGPKEQDFRKMVEQAKQNMFASEEPEKKQERKRWFDV